MVKAKKESFTYERLIPDSLPWYHKKMYKDHLGRYIFASNYVKNKEVLDIACGVGYGSKILIKAGAKKVVGIDNSNYAIKYAKRAYGHESIKYIEANALKIPLKDDSFDLIVSFETLEHIKNYKKFISEIKRVLKKNGILIISTPNELLNTQEVNPYHFKEFSQVEFAKLLSDNFRNVQMFGQKPVHGGYLKLVGQITSKLPPGKIRWIVDSGLKIFFRGSNVLAIDKYKFGFTPSYLVGVAVKNKN